MEPRKTSISCWTMSACLFHHTAKGLRCLPLYCTAHPYNGTNLEDAAWSRVSQYCRYSWHVCSQKQIWKVPMVYNFCMDVIDYVYIHKNIYILHTVVARHAHLSASLPAPFGRAAALTALTTVTTIVEIPQPLPTECSNLQRRSNSHQKGTSSKKPGLHQKIENQLSNNLVVSIGGVPRYLGRLVLCFFWGGRKCRQSIQDISASRVTFSTPLPSRLCFQHLVLCCDMLWIFMVVEGQKL